MKLEERGRPADEVLAELRRRHEGDLPTHGGRTWAYVYDAGWPGLDELLAEAHRTFSAVNGLDPTVFPSIVTMENDLVGTALELLSGPPGAVGTFTSGGTESCMLSVKAARDARPEVERPRMVVPTTVHPAFLKGGKYFGVEPVTVPVDAKTCRADPAATVAAIARLSVAPSSRRVKRRPSNHRDMKPPSSCAEGRSTWVRCPARGGPLRDR